MVWRNARILQYPCWRTNVSSTLCWHGSGLWLSISSYVGTWTFHCDPAGNEWCTAHCNTNSVRSIPPPSGVRNKWNDSTNKIPYVLLEANLPCHHLTSRNKPHVASLTWASCAVHISTNDISNQFILLLISSWPWRYSEITLCDGLQQVFFSSTYKLCLDSKRACNSRYCCFYCTLRNETRVVFAWVSSILRVKNLHRWSIS